MKSKITVALDAAYPHLGLDAGHQVTFADGLPTIDDGLGFYISQLASLESKIYEAKYTAINFAEMVPVVTDLPEWADSWDYVSYDGVTVGKFIGSSADDLPNVSLSANKTSVPIGYAGNEFSYSLDELRKSQQLRIPIDTSQAKLAFRGSQEHLQRLAYFGDASRGMTGLFNNPNVALDNSTVNWATATGAAIVADMNDLLTEVWINSANTHLPNALAIDSVRYAQIATAPMSQEFPNKTILQFFKETNLYTTTTGQPIRIFPRLQLTAASLAANGVSNGGKARMLAYELNDENLGMANPMPWRALAPQMRGLNVVVPAEYKGSGVSIRYLFSAAYRDAL
jgi:hypothetical protein